MWGVKERRTIPLLEGRRRAWTGGSLGGQGVEWWCWWACFLVFLYLACLFEWFYDDSFLKTLACLLLFLFWSLASVKMISEMLVPLLLACLVIVFTSGFFQWLFWDCFSSLFWLWFWVGYVNPMMNLILRVFVGVLILMLALWWSCSEGSLNAMQFVSLTRVWQTSRLMQAFGWTSF